MVAVHSPYYDHLLVIDSKCVKPVKQQMLYLRHCLVFFHYSDEVGIFIYSFLFFHLRLRLTQKTLQLPFLFFLSFSTLFQ